MGGFCEYARIIRDLIRRLAALKCLDADYFRAITLTA